MLTGSSDTAPLIRKLERFSPLSEEARSFLYEPDTFQTVEYEPRTPIVIEGDCPNESCFVVEGFAYRFKSLEQGTRQIMALHVPGDFCDLHSFLLKRMDHGIVAMDHCRIAKVPHRKIQEITDRFPDLTRALWWDTALDAAVHREWMISMGRRSAHQQMAHLFCELFLRLRSVGLVEGDSYYLPITQAELADMFGLSQVHVNRTLQALRREAGIEVKAKRVTIPRFDRLAELGGFDPTYLHVRGGPGLSAIER